MQPRPPHLAPAHGARTRRPVPARALGRARLPRRATGAPPPATGRAVRRAGCRPPPAGLPWRPSRHSSRS
ncbi:MAG: hypothetical protein EOO25_16990 [Comamonadaceae bacterium]|nr:MAG: hypothetical protein EOO25_16990 [Comamonadaceae bacterium]